MMRTLLTIVLLAVSLTLAADQAAPVGPPDFAALSGEWTGTSTLLQRGGCTISGTGRTDTPMRAKLEVAADGTFKANVVTGLRKSPSPPLSGVFRPDGSVEATQVAEAVCGGEKRTFTVAYSGTFSTQKRRSRLELAADTPLCPQMKCLFERRYQLTHK